MTPAYSLDRHMHQPELIDPPSWLEAELGRRVARRRPRRPKPRPVSYRRGSRGRSPLARIAPVAPLEIDEDVTLLVKEGHRVAVKTISEGVWVVAKVPDVDVGTVAEVPGALLNLLMRALGPVFEKAKQRRALRNGGGDSNTANMLQAANVGCGCGSCGCRGRR